MTRRPVVLTIAGSDSSGGAGIQADLKTFHQFGVYGASAVTLVTAQNTLGVVDSMVLPAELVARQIDAVVSDLTVEAVKIGALGNAEVIRRVACCLDDHGFRFVVVDPVLISSHGDPLLSQDAHQALLDLLVPRATLLTPNLEEASVLAGRPVREPEDMEAAAWVLRGKGAGAVLIKGGHGSGERLVDGFLDGEGWLVLPVPRVETRHTHGTGCTLSAAITALLARGWPVRDAVRRAQAYVARAIAGAPGLGGGHGPIDHWASED